MGFPGATSRESSMQVGGCQLCDVQADLTSVTELRVKWIQELNKCVMRWHFTAVKGMGPVRRGQYRLFLLEYPDLAAKVTEQRIADQKRTILVRHLLSEVEIETTKILINHPPVGAIEPIENATNAQWCQALSCLAKIQNSNFGVTS